MDSNNDYRYVFQFQPKDQPPQKPEPQKPAGEWRCPVSLLLGLLCCAVVATMLFTYAMTAAWTRKESSEQLLLQQQQIAALQAALEGGSEFDKLNYLAALFEQFSYYSNKFDKDEMLDEVLRAYSAATGDAYADYYTPEEYEQLKSDNEGTGVGIGISVVQTPLTFNGYQYQTFHVIAIYKNAPAEGSGIRVGDYVYAIKIDGTYMTVAGMGGYTNALNAFRGEAGSTVEFLVLRPNGNDGYTEHSFSVTRGAFVKESVNYKKAENAPTVGIIHISEFDLNTPTQFKEAVRALQADGVEHFVFDVRNNPGGDLQSIKAVLTYFLERDDLILSAIDNKGNVAASYVAETMDLIGEYAKCNVSEEEIGMFADLDMVVLCNENTASAAEVFTASLRDHKNVTIVGKTTYGKGIMQQFFNLSAMTYGAYDGYVKMTTYAYVTECGETYHDIGIAPGEGYEVALSDEAQQYNFYLLPQALDNQLQKALTVFQNQN